MKLKETERFCDVISRAVVTDEVCSSLSNLGILDVGVTRAGSQWCFIRMAPAYSLVLVSIDGRGTVVCDDRWQSIGPETAYLMPAGVTHGYSVAKDSADWNYAWVRFSDTTKFSALFSSSVPKVFPAASHSLHAANRGLIGEVERSNDPQLVGLWCELLQASLHHLVNPMVIDPRLESLWSYVNEHLNDSWDMNLMASRVHMSTEHLRRLCHKYYGCSPRQKLTALRLRRACEFLVGTDAKLDVIAENVGFSDAFSFSQAFKREHGKAPSLYRQEARLTDALSRGIA